MIIVNERVNNIKDFVGNHKGGAATKVRIKKTGQMGYVDEVVDDLHGQGIRVIFNNRPGMYPEFFNIDEVEIIGKRANESLNKQDILRKLDKFQKTIRIDSKDEKELIKILDDKHIAYMIDDGSIPGKSTFQLDYDSYRKYK